MTSTVCNIENGDECNAACGVCKKTGMIRGGNLYGKLGNCSWGSVSHAVAELQMHLDHALGGLGRRGSGEQVVCLSPGHWPFPLFDSLTWGR